LLPKKRSILGTAAQNFGAESGGFLPFTACFLIYFSSFTENRTFYFANFFCFMLKK